MPRTPRNEIPDIVLGDVCRKPREVRLVLTMPDLKEVKGIMMESDSGLEKVSVELTRSLKFDDARRNRQGNIRVSGQIKLETIELEELRTLTVEPDGSYSFVGLHVEVQEWEYNYNAGTGREVTRTTYKISVDAFGLGTYKVLSRTVN